MCLWGGGEGEEGGWGGRREVIFRESMKKTGCTIRWAPTRLQLADSVTKDKGLRMSSPKPEIGIKKTLDKSAEAVSKREEFCDRELLR